MVDYENCIQRVENMVYEICGCNLIDAEIVLEGCLKNNKNKQKPSYVK